jgi:hypothetical protein
MFRCLPELRGAAGRRGKTTMRFASSTIFSSTGAVRYAPPSSCCKYITPDDRLARRMFTVKSVFLPPKPSSTERRLLIRPQFY